MAILLVDDHPLVRETMAGALDRQPDMHVIGMAGTVAEVGEVRIPRPDVAIVDYVLPDGTGVDACRQVKARWPGTRIVSLSAETGEDVMLATLQAGTDAFVGKTEHFARVLHAVREVHAGRAIVPPALLGRMSADLRGEGGAIRGAHGPMLREHLTSRELTVLRLLANGHATNRIAAELGMAPGTVRRHVEAIRRKLGVHSRLEAVSEAIRFHIVELPAN